MNLENIMLSKSDRKSQEPYDLTHRSDVKLKAANEQTRQTKPHRHRQQHGGDQRESGGWGGSKREWGQM